MSEFPHLKNAPIREALVDIRVRSSPEVTIDTLQAVYQAIESDYPSAEPIRIREFGFFATLEQMQTTTVDHGQVGIRCTSNDKTKVVQLRKDGFTYSQLKPYKNWPDMTQEARRIWEKYESGLRIEAITRIATRFINVLPLPLAGQDLGEYFFSPPTLPEGISQPITSFLSRIVFLAQEQDATVIFTQAMEPSPDRHVPVVLDIDVYCERTDGVWEKDVWQVLDTLRDVKNGVFFSSVKPKAFEFFK
jgi:uncharacterized protein (TIGR04255 family)